MSKLAITRGLAINVLVYGLQLLLWRVVARGLCDALVVARRAV